MDEITPEGARNALETAERARQQVAAEVGQTLTDALDSLTADARPIRSRSDTVRLIFGAAAMFQCAAHRQ